MSASPNDASRAEFVTDAEELVETLSRDLLLLDQAVRLGEPSGESLNDLFRSVHTLKGLAGMFGFAAVARIAHALEDLLEGLRMGRAPLTGEALDLLFQSVERFQTLLAAHDDARPTGESPEDFVARVHALAHVDLGTHDVLEDYVFEPGFLLALSAHEEQRLRTHLTHGDGIYRFVLALPAERIDGALADLKQKLARDAELITVLPGLSPEEHGVLGLEILVATRLPEAELRRAFEPLPGNLFKVRKRTSASMQPAALLPPAVRASEPEPPSPKSPSVASSSALTGRPQASVVRVEVRKLDELRKVVGELSGVRRALFGLVEKLRDSSLDPELVLQVFEVERTLGRQLSALEEAVLRVRMVPLSQVFDKLAVVVRQLAREQRKSVQLLVAGARTEVDKLVAEEVADPLLHLVRNAIDHGIEGPKERADKGKPPLATVHVHAYSKGNHVVIEVRDDGRGIDPAEIRKAAIENGVITETQARGLSRAEILDLLFVPGFSTSANVSDVSGRGIGLDVVKTNVKRLGGDVQVQSDAASGTLFVLTLPITRAMTRALLLAVRGQRFLLPTACVEEVLRIEPASVLTIEDREFLDLRGTTLPVIRLGEFLCLRSEPPSRLEPFVVVLAVRDRRLGLLVDRVHGQREVVIEPFGPSLSGVRVLAGATELEDRRLALVLDAAAIVDEVLSLSAGRLRQDGTT